MSVSFQTPIQDENVTVIEVSSNQQTQDALTPLDYQGVFNFNFVDDALPSNTTLIENSNYGEAIEVNETFYTPPVTPAITPQITGEGGNSQVEVVESGSSYYECVFLPSMAQTPGTLESPASEATSHNNVHSGNDGTETEVSSSRNSSSRSNDAPSERYSRTNNSSSESTQRSNESAPISIVRSSSLNAAEAVVNESHHNSRRRRSSSNCENTPSPSGVSQAPRMERTRVAGTRTDMERRLQPAPHPYRQVQVKCVIDIPVIFTHNLVLYVVM